MKRSPSGEKKRTTKTQRVSQCCYLACSNSIISNLKIIYVNYLLLFFLSFLLLLLPLFLLRLQLLLVLLQASVLSEQTEQIKSRIRFWVILVIFNLYVGQSFSPKHTYIIHHSKIHLKSFTKIDHEFSWHGDKKWSIEFFSGSLRRRMIQG